MSKIDHGEDLFRLVYASRAVLPELPRFHALVEDVLRVARPNNARNNITGLLIADLGWFVQVLEGPRRKVSRTFGDIGRDLRHVQIETLAAGPVETRLFGEWSMCARTLGPQAAAVMGALEMDGDFDPFALSGDKAVQLMLALAPLDQTEPLRKAG